MIYELRIYDCLPGRLPALLKRFNEHTLALWERHGIRQAGFFTTLVGENNNRLTYLLAWESLAEREAKWTAFIADPDWISARDASERDGPILANVRNELLNPTAFSSVR
ncbi:NIPSNAP family protein [Devosia sp. PTR5]|uniref:NIPSNAP family protein n=1 Tax=Devosia oryzisoli TaxID=2774138 RepID=A0A927FV95_9HYPH|nr:NIPSNAP family protein [Devosia oryzisoli]MBD8066157.1 NIPSNAP family protein [Devosia oryzisoli]